MTDPAAARARLVELLCATGCAVTPAVVAAFAAVPRHLFLPGVPVAEAYADEAVPTRISGGVAVSSASQPSMIAIMLEQLAVLPGHRVLEIGAGTGYNAALLAHLAGAVTSVDIDDEVVATAAEHLAAAGVEGVDLRVGDGAVGVPDRAPYDRIELTVGSDEIRPEWVAQLAPGGRLLLPLGVRGSQLSVAFDLDADGVLHSASVRSCAFIRLRGIGAGPEPTVPVRPGWSAQLAEGAEVDPAEVGAVLDDPRGLRRGPQFAPADVWDGPGLWLLLTVPGAVRLLTGLTAEPPGSWLLRTGTGAAAVGVAVPGGLALPVAAPPGVRAFGPGGRAAVGELRRGLWSWVAAGRPRAADLRILALPPGMPVPDRGAVVQKEFCRLVISS